MILFLADVQKLNPLKMLYCATALVNNAFSKSLGTGQ